MTHLLIFLASILASETEDYLNLLSNHPHLAKKGEAKDGEIELVLEPSEISKVEELQTNRWMKKGHPLEKAKSYSRVGIIAEDPYWIWIRDAVLFPNGSYGTYERVLWKRELQQSFPGVAVLPILQDGRILLNRNYRHATRSWEWEMPRGLIETGESPAKAAQRELKEETGWSSENPEYLGSMAVDSGILCSIVPVYSCRLIEKGMSHAEDSEAIEGCYAFTIAEIKEGLKNGSFDGVSLRDPFLTFALLQFQIRNEETGS